jgi:hypothetical protein
MNDAKKKLDKVLFFFIALGTVLPMMHQSSLGTLLVVMGPQINPLWQTPIVPLLYLLSAITIGYGGRAVRVLRRRLGLSPRDRSALLQPMAKIMLGLLAVPRGAGRRPDDSRGARSWRFGAAWKPSVLARNGLCFLLPFLLGSRDQAAQSGQPVPGRRALMLGGILLRINGFLIGYDTGLGVDHGWNYFPSVPEMLVTIGMFAIEVLGYIVITRRFPVLPREDAAAATEFQERRTMNKRITIDPGHPHRRPSARRRRSRWRPRQEGLGVRPDVARRREHPDRPRPARRLGDHPAHLRRVHHGACHRLGARGGKCAAAGNPGQRAVHPQHDHPGARRA